MRRIIILFSVLLMPFASLSAQEYKYEAKLGWFPVGALNLVYLMGEDSDMPEEIKTIGSSLTAIAQNVEKLRSSKTYFHGKTDDDYVAPDPMYTYFVFNAVCTIALFLKSFYIKNYPDQDCMDDLPF